jgi:hypothetical protein
MTVLWFKDQVYADSNVGYDQFLIDFKNNLKTAGWTCPAAGNGATWGWNYDVTAWGGSYGDGWIVFKQPAAVNGVQRQWLFKRNWAYRSQWDYIRYSYSAGFTGGSPNANTPPTASDSVDVSAPSYGKFLHISTGGSNRVQMFADNAPPYSFGYWSHPLGGGAATNFFCMDPLLPDTYPSADTDPYVFYFSHTYNLTIFGTQFNDPTAQYCAKAYFNKGLASAAFANCPGLLLKDNAGIVVPSALGPNPYTGTDEVFPVFYGRRLGAGAPVGFKGQSSLFLYSGTPRNTSDTLTLLTTRDRYYIANGVSVPWDGTEPNA